MPRIDTHEPGAPSWVDLLTGDLDAATRFYTGLFGWWAVDVPMPDGRGVYRMFRQDGRDVAGAGEQSPEMVAQGARSAWTVYVAGDADTAAERAASAGGGVVMPPADVGDSGRITVLADPDGAAIGVWEARAHAGAGLLGEPCAMTWCEVSTRAFDACRDFYGRVFGWTAKDLSMEGVRYATWERGDAGSCAGMLEMDEHWEGLPPHWMAYFAVDDTDAAARRADELGGTVSVPPFDTPFGRVAVLTDPTGAVFSVIRASDPPGGATTGGPVDA